jgi:hypothetical protein
MILPNTAFQLYNPDAQSLHLTFNCFLMKLFKTSDINVINECRLHFGIKSPSEQLVLRRSNIYTYDFVAFVIVYTFGNERFCNDHKNCNDYILLYMSLCYFT